MPTQAFYNLSEEKKERIMKVAKQEFRKHSFYDVSINKIIKEADISRGSFYLYFENKKDLFIYIMDLYKLQRLNDIKERFQGRKCTIFDLMIITFDDFTSDEKDNEMKEFFLMTILNMDTRLAMQLFSMPEHFNDFQSEMADFLDVSDMRISNDSDLKNIIEIIGCCLMTQLFAVHMDQMDVGEARATLERKCNLIKYGVLKPEAR